MQGAAVCADPDIGRRRRHCPCSSRCSIAYTRYPCQSSFIHIIRFAALLILAIAARRLATLRNYLQKGDNRALPRRLDQPPRPSISTSSTSTTSSASTPSCSKARSRSNDGKGWGTPALTFVNGGSAATSPSGGLSRLPALIAEKHPTVCVICFGMNDRFKGPQGLTSRTCARS